MGTLLARKKTGRVIAAVAVLVWLSACESSSSSTTSSSTTTTTTLPGLQFPAVEATNCPSGRTCELGDTGPGGGVIVYVNNSGFKCGKDMTETCNFIEVAPADWAKDVTLPEGCSIPEGKVDPQCPWSQKSDNYWNSAGNQIFSGEPGSGFKEGLPVLKNELGTSSAVAVARAYAGGGKQDWTIMPYKAAKMFCTYARNSSGLTNREECAGSNSIRTGFEKSSYWTLSVPSGPTNLDKAATINIANGFVGISLRTSMQFVRPMRVFAASASSTTTVVSTTTTVRATTTIASTTTTVKAVKTCAQGGQCAVGDTGPGGGTVFYVSTTPFTCGSNLDATCQYLEFAPKSWKADTASSTNCTAVDSYNVKCVWGPTTPSISTSGAVGQGYKNTMNIVTGAGVLSTWASTVSRAYQGGGKSDWHLPSQHELDEMCKYANGKPTGNQSVGCTAGSLMDSFLGQNYWSSNDGGGGTAIAINFATGSQSFPAKGDTYIIRPVRAFKPN